MLLKVREKSCGTRCSRDQTTPCGTASLECRLDVLAGERMLARELEVATTLALEAGEVLRQTRAGGLEVTYKGTDDPVTQADLAADALIRSGLARAFPDDGLLSEETADSSERLGKHRVWIIDPIDSTSNYARGGDQHAVSIGFALNGQATLGVVYNPARAELFAGVVGQGVRLNGSSVWVTNTFALEQSRISVSRSEWKRGLSDHANAFPMRLISSIAYKLARVAAGLEDGVFTAAPRSEWDVCAGVALVLASGGMVTLRDGSALRFNRSNPEFPSGVVASNPVLHAVLLERMQGMPVIHFPD